MNAYELAEKIHKAVNADEKHLTLDIEAMIMLRQQADRIAELEGTSAKEDKRLKDLYASQLKFTTPQTKPLSDEEIEYITKQWFKCRSDTKLTEQFVMPLYSVLDLCKTILKQTNKK